MTGCRRVKQTEPLQSQYLRVTEALVSQSPNERTGPKDRRVAERRQCILGIFLSGDIFARPVYARGTERALHLETRSGSDRRLEAAEAARGR